MKNKKTVLLLSFLVGLGIIAFFVYRVNRPILFFKAARGSYQFLHTPTSVVGDGRSTSHQKLSADPWKIWINQKTDQSIKDMLAARKKKNPFANPMQQSQIESWKARNRRSFADFAALMKKKYPSPTAMEANGEGMSLEFTFEEGEPSERYTGPQTVEALMEMFDAYDRSGYTDTSVEARYPRDEWLSVLLDKGVMVGDYSDYSLYMNGRLLLMQLENDPETWASGRDGIPPTDDWETFKAAYIDRKAWEFQQIYAARQIDPDVFGGQFMGPDGQTYLPGRPGRVYVERTEGGGSFYGTPLTNKQIGDILYKGKHPEGYEIIYIDENGSILSEVPPPVPIPTKEEAWQQYKEWLKEEEGQTLERAFGTAPSENWDEWNTQAGGSLEIETNLKKAQAAQKQFERAQTEALERATKSDTEIEAELEKQLTPEPPMAAGIETQLSERFAPERLEKAREVLERYGPEEGMRRLREDDPEVATQFERGHRDRNPAGSETEEPENPTR